MSTVKINLSSKDCSGISLLTANTNTTATITSTTCFKANGYYKLQLRVQVVKDGKRFQQKKTVKFNKNTTLNQAVNQMIALRVKIYDSLKDGTTQELRLGSIGKDPTETLNIIFDKYIEAKKKVLAPKTIGSYVSFYDTWIRNAIGSYEINTINESHLQTIVNKVLSKRAPKTAKTLKEILNPIFKKYFYSGTIHSNPVELLEFKKFDNVVNPDLSDKEIKALYSSIYSYGVEPYRSIFIWLSTGRRVNEVLSLKWEDIYFATERFTIKADNNKAKKNMVYVLDEDLLSTLKSLKQGSGYIFHSIKDKNKKMHNDTIKRHWKYILENAGIGHLRIHDLRHIVGLKLVNAGVSLEVIASVLGHTTTSITKRYSKVRTKTAADALAQFKELVK